VLYSYPNAVEKLVNGKRLICGGHWTDQSALNIAKPRQYSLFDELRRSADKMFPVGDGLVGTEEKLAGGTRQPADRVDTGLQRLAEPVVDRTHQRFQQPRHFLRNAVDTSYQNLQHDDKTSPARITQHSESYTSDKPERLVTPPSESR